jgi:hypothetical protein
MACGVCCCVGNPTGVQLKCFMEASYLGPCDPSALAASQRRFEPLALTSQSQSPSPSRAPLQRCASATLVRRKSVKSLYMEGWGTPVERPPALERPATAPLAQVRVRVYACA